MASRKAPFSKYARKFAKIRFGLPSAGPPLGGLWAAWAGRVEWVSTVWSMRGVAFAVEFAWAYSSAGGVEDRKSTRLNSSHVAISYAVFCLKKKNTQRKFT